MSKLKEENLHYRRNYKNFLLVPKIQIKLGFYTLALAIATAGILWTIIYHKLGMIFGIIIHLTDAEDEVKSLLQGISLEMSIWLIAVLIAYVITNFLLSIIFTHRMIGPTYAFRRHISGLIEGKYTTKTTLRPNDAFIELANDLNHLSDTLNQKMQK